MPCSALEHWYVGVVEPAKTERVALQTIAASRNILEIINLRWMKRRVAREQGLTFPVYDQYYMIPGYLFLKGLGAQLIRDLPFAPRLLKIEEDFMTVSEDQITQFMVRKHREAPLGSIFEDDKIIVPASFEPPEYFGAAHRKMARKQRETYIRALAA